MNKSLPTGTLILVAVLVLVIQGLKTQQFGCKVSLVNVAQLEADVSQSNTNISQWTANNASQSAITTAPSLPPRLFFVVTTSIQTDEGNGERQEDVRQRQYTRGILTLLNETRVGFPIPHRIIVVENNGKRHTFLDEIPGINVLYTQSNNNNNNNNNNNMTNGTATTSKGIKELSDLRSCIEHFGMRPDDLIVKMTGRYYLSPNSQFMSLLQHLDWQTTRAIVRFGPYHRRNPNRPMPDCVTGLIMLPVSTILQVKPVNIIEFEIGRLAMEIPDPQLHVIKGYMGINICPGGSKYFLV